MKKKCIAIILAAGQGTRMGTKTRKQYLKIAGKPILYYAVEVFDKSELIDEIILVTGAGEIEYVRETIVQEYGFEKISRIVEGGKERYDSVWNALKTIEQSEEDDAIVFIHDGARPFPDEQILERTYEEAVKKGACVAGMPVKDTIKIVDKNRAATETPDRRTLWIVQTPQVFQSRLIIEAYRQMMRSPHENVTDDAMAVERMTGNPVFLVEGSYENIKVTTPEDLKIAEIFAASRNKISR